jgi:signal transduction histidine kinase
MPIALETAALVAVITVSAFALGWFCAAQRQRHRLGERLSELEKSEQSAVRQIRIASYDLRAIGLRLHGNAGVLVAGQVPQAGEIASAAYDVFDMADDLHGFTMRADGTRVISDETIELAPAMRDAMLSVSTAMGPGRRTWDLAPELAVTRLRADRRALRHIFSRVLAEAVRATGHDDRIRIGVIPQDNGLAVVIADERGGQPGAGAVRQPQLDSRGLDSRLLLARALMHAHDGHLELDVRPGMGTTVRLVFPADRVVRAATATPPAEDTAPISREMQFSPT